MSSKENSCDFNIEIKTLKEKGPANLYHLYGPESYLRDSFLDELKRICLSDGENDFSYKRFEGEFDSMQILNAMDLMPFMTERTLIEIRDADFSSINSEIFDDIPDYCTLVFVSQNDPDSRLKAVKALRSKGRDLYFGLQQQGRLIKWTIKRFNALGKSIDENTVKRLIFISGELMSGLIPEINKISSFTSNETITINDVNTLAHHIPEADTFEMIDFISKKDFKSATRILNDVLSDKSNTPIAIFAALGFNLRRMYGQKLKGYSTSFKLKNLEDDIRYCCDCEYRSKFSIEDDKELIKDALLHIMINENK